MILQPGLDLIRPEHLLVVVRIFVETVNLTELSCEKIMISTSFVCGKNVLFKSLSYSIQLAKGLSFKSVCKNVAIHFPTYMSKAKSVNVEGLVVISVLIS